MVLSPAAQAVLDAYIQGLATKRRDAIAAALRAAAEQVVPEADIADTEEWNGQSAWQQAEHCVRFRLLSLANELEGQ
jgi:hypothetical protein